MRTPIVAILCLLIGTSCQGGLVVGFVTVDAGVVQLSPASGGGGRSLTAPAHARLDSGALLRTDSQAAGELLFFDGSAFTMMANQTVRLTGDGVLVEQRDGWLLAHGFLVRHTRGNLNSVLRRGSGPASDWFATGTALVHGSAGPTPPSTTGRLYDNALLRTGDGAYAKLDGRGRGMVVLKGNTDLRLLPGGFSLERGGVLVHLGLQKAAGLWTRRVRATAMDAFCEISSIGERDEIRVLKGRVELRPTVGAGWRTVVRGGQHVTVDGTRAPTVKRFKGPQEARRVARDLIRRMNERGLAGFPDFTGASLPVVATAGATASATAGASAGTKRVPASAGQGTAAATAELRPGPPIGRDNEGRAHLDPLRRRPAGADPGDWQSVQSSTGADQSARP